MGSGRRKTTQTIYRKSLGHYTGTVTLQVSSIEELNFDGPILLPWVEGIPFLARPLTFEEEAWASTLAQSHGLNSLERSAPICVIGTAADLNAATDNGLQRATDLLDMSLPEVKNRARITGAIEIGCHPGVVQIAFRAPLENLEHAGLLPLVSEYHGIEC